MNVEQLGNLAKNRYPNSTEYSGKSDREVGLLLMRKHRAYRGRQKVPEDKVITQKETLEETKPERKTITVQGRKLYADTGKPVEGAFGPTIISKPPEEKLTVPETIKGVGLGITKGSAETLAGISSLGQKGLEATVGRVINYALGKVGITPAPKTPTASEYFRSIDAFKAENKAEKFGKGVEEIAEFFIPYPGGKAKTASKGLAFLEKVIKPKTISKVEKVVSKTISTAEKVVSSTDPKVLNIIAKGTKILSKPTVSKAIKEGIRFGGITAIKEGEIGKEAKEAAIVGAAFPVGLSMFSMMAKPISKVVSAASAKAQEKLWINILRRSKEDIAKHPIAMDVAKQRMFAWNADNVNTKFVKEINKLTPILEKALNKKSSTIQIETFKKSVFNTAIKELEKTTTKYDPLIKDYKLLTRSSVDIIVNKYIKPGQKSISRNEALKLALNLSREVENKVIARTKDDISIPSLVAKELFERTKKALPEMKDKVTRIAVLTEALPAMRQSINTGKEIPAIGQTEWLLGLGGEMLGVGGVKLVLGKKVYDSVAFKSFSSKTLNKFNSLIESDKIPFYLGTKAFLAATIDELIGEK